MRYDSNRDYTLDLDVWYPYHPYGAETRIAMVTSDALRHL